VESIFAQWPEIRYVEFSALLRSPSVKCKSLIWRVWTDECSIVEDLGPSLAGTSSRFRQGLRSKWNRLRKRYALERVHFRTEREPNVQEIKRIIELNRDKIESHGRTHGVQPGGAYEEAIIETCKQVGVTFSLYIGQRLIAGAIVYLCGSTAFLQTVGYDQAFS